MRRELSRFGEDCFAVVRQFYDSPVYAELERESSKYWWMSLEQIELGYGRVMAKVDATIYDCHARRGHGDAAMPPFKHKPRHILQ